MAANRSRQMHTLALQIERATGLRTDAEYVGARAGEGWMLSWAGGPTPTEMRQLATRTAARHVPGLDLTGVHFYRGLSDHSEAVCLLRWIDSQPDPDRAAADANTFLVSTAVEAISYPEHSEQHWHDRAENLLRHVHGYNLYTGRPTAALADYTRAHTWAHTLAWLDAMTTARHDPDVAQLDQARARRAQRRQQ